MQALLSSPQATQLDTLGLRDWNKGISEQELGPMDSKDSKATPQSGTRGESRDNSQLHRTSFHIIHGDSL